MELPTARDSNRGVLAPIAVQVVAVAVPPKRLPLLLPRTKSLLSVLLAMLEGRPRESDLGDVALGEFDGILVSSLARESDLGELDGKIVAPVITCATGFRKTLSLEDALKLDAEIALGAATNEYPGTSLGGAAVKEPVGAAAKAGFHARD